MSRFNTATTAVSHKTVNLAGGEAFIESPKLELVSILLTSFVKDQFYRKEEAGLERLREVIAAIPDKRFIAKTALYARNQFGMRSITHVAAGELAKVIKGEPWFKNFIAQVCHRPDDMMEILGYYTARFGVEHINGKGRKVRRPIPNSLKKGFSIALSGFSAYQLAKYKKEGKGISMVDLVNLCHPKASDDLTALMKGTLKPADTWETKLTQAGHNAETEEQKGELKAEAWKELIAERKIGYFALLRNLRNILQQAPEMVEAACELLCDEGLIRKSLVLPFRYTTAIDEIKKLSEDGSRQVVVAISKALDIACKNVPVFTGKTLVALDCSGSMEGKPAEIGSLFAAVILKSNDADLICFSNESEYKGINPLDSVTSIASSIRFAFGGTNFQSIFERAKKAYDRIIILSDMQGWIGHTAPTSNYEAYCARHNCRPNIFSFDLQGYGTLQFPQPQVYAIAGFSEKILDVMRLLEQNKDALIQEIEKVEI